MLKKFSLRAKLIGGFLTVAALCATLGIFGIVRLQNLSATSQSTMTANSHALLTLAELEVRSMELRVSVNRLVALDAPDSRARLRLQTQGDVERLHRAMSAYEHTIQEDPAQYQERDHAYFNEVAQAVNRYETSIKEPVLDALAANDRAHAVKILNEQGGQLYSELEKAINQLTDFNVEIAKQNSAGLMVAARSAIYLMCGVIVLVVAMAIVIGVILTLSITRPMEQLKVAAERIASGDVSQTVTYEAKDEVGALANAFRTMTETIKEHAVAAQAVASGDMSITVRPRSEQDVMGKSLELCVKNVKKLVSDSTLLATAAVDGNLNTRADATQHQGDYRKVVEGINAALEAMATPLARSIEHLEKLAKGINGEHITKDYKGDYARLRDGFNGLFDSIRRLVEDSSALVRAGHEGRLDARADASRHNGDFHTIIDGINKLLDATLLPIEEGNRVLRQIRGGNLRERVEIECRGDHQKMKDAVNGVHDWLKGLVEYVTRMANGDMTADMDKASDQDQIFEWLVLLKSNIVQLQSELGRLIAAAKNGDLVQRGDPRHFKGAYSELMVSVNDMFEVFRSTIETVGRMSEPLTQAAGELSRVAHEMGSSAEQTASQANMVSAGSEQVSRNIQTVATAADEMGASIREIAKNTADATKVATAAVRSAEDTNVTIGKLGQSSAEIGQVIKVITSIAQQTNLLALNATIEAARAGEAGKGFAVVANEVKELAKETAKATEDISRKIEAIQTDTKGAVAAIEQIGSVIGQINDIQNTVASAVEEQSVTTNEITRNLTEAAKGGSDISHSIAGVAEAARTTTGGASQTQKSAETLEKLAEDLQAVMGRFRYESVAQRVNPAIAAQNRNLHHELVGATIQ